MILIGSALENSPVMSLQTGAELARTKRPIINPANLGIIAYELEGPLLDQTPSLLRIADVRELSDLGFIVDSSDEFVKPDDVIKIQEVYNLHFNLIGMSVTDEKNSKLGKITDFTLDTSGFIIQQLTVRRPLIRSLNDTELVIHRTQIIEINDNSIVVHSQAKVPEPEAHEVVGSYINPFRKSETANESVSRSKR
ncbi:PRC-barrel domain-containing protein [Microbacteriaceae bacterium]|nr:PRC-barrel domain-containing protein [Candidatus Saccharibacteria bacterium]